MRDDGMGAKDYKATDKGKAVVVDGHESLSQTPRFCVVETKYIQIKGLAKTVTKADVEYFCMYYDVGLYVWATSKP
jgi:hypothetical protein